MNRGSQVGGDSDVDAVLTLENADQGGQGINFTHGGQKGAGLHLDAFLDGNLVFVVVCVTALMEIVGHEVSIRGLLGGGGKKGGAGQGAWVGIQKGRGAQGGGGGRGGRVKGGTVFAAEEGGGAWVGARAQDGGVNNGGGGDLGAAGHNIFEHEWVLGLGVLGNGGGHSGEGGS